MRSWLQTLNQPVDGASLAAYRILFGLMMAVSVLRYAWMGWIERSFIEPEIFLKYWGFEWVPVPGPAGVYILFGVLFLSSILITIGAWGRWPRGIFLVSFAWVELMDASNYLNHYYLVTLLGVLNLFLPLNQVWSFDAWRGAARHDQVPLWSVWILRFQFCVVYFFAGLAKLTSDWLLHAQPISLWLSPNTDWPLLGPLFELNLVHYAMAWAGFLYDSLIWIFLLWAPSRPFAYGLVLLFHGMTHLLFPIGLFPFLMTLGTLIFFSPSWPRNFLQQAPRLRPQEPLPSMASQGGLLVLGLYVLIQLALPLRSHVLYDNQVLWSEEGMRWSWRVMAREKNGAVDFRVREQETGREWLIPAASVLRLHQELEMSGQPELILQVAHHLADEFAAKGQRVQVFAEAWVSLNGRTPALMIDPKVDLTQEVDSWKPKAWILPAPTEETRLLGRWSLL